MIGIRIYGSVLFLIAGGGFIWSAFFVEQMGLLDRFVMGGSAAAIVVFAGITIWKPSLLSGGAKK